MLVIARGYDQKRQHMATESDLSEPHFLHETILQSFSDANPRCLDGKKNMDHGTIMITKKSLKIAGKIHHFGWKSNFQ